MKYYSDVTRQVYDTEDALKQAEEAEAKRLAEIEEKNKKRGERAKEIEEAYKAILDAQAHYTELRNKFIEDFGSFHMTVSNKSPVRWSTDFTNLFDFFFNF